MTAREPNPTTPTALPVRDLDRCADERISPAATVRRLIGPREGSPLTLDHLELAPGSGCTLPQAPEDHQLIYVLGGAATLTGGDGDQPIRAGTAFLRTPATGIATVTSSREPLRLAVFGAGAGCDVHAALGESVTSNQLDLEDADSATGSRSFQVLLGPENGCCRATLFVGVVPPGAAPWHFHQYDEIVYLIRGQGRYHQADGRQPTRPGSAVRIPPRTVHINENCSDEDMHVLGVFTPAGSPSAAFLSPDPTR